MIKTERPPFSYYGGKQRIASKIVPYIPRHTVYVEPFSGAGTIMFKKQTPLITNTHHYREVLNDTNNYVVNFFKVLQDKDKANELISKLKLTPKSRTIFNKIENKIKSNNFDNDIDKAYCFYYKIMLSFSNIFNGAYGYNLKARNIGVTYYKKVNNLENYIERMRYVEIENLDALTILDKYDSANTFFYIDPPYPNTEQGHYKGYSIEDYTKLINKLKTIKGSFILSCYRQGIEPTEWKSIDIESVSSVSNTKIHKEKADNKRTETIWIVDNGGGINDEYYRKIYNKPEFQDIWNLNNNQRIGDLW